MKPNWANGLFYLLISSCCLLLLQLGVKYEFTQDLSLNQQNSLHASTRALLQNLRGPLALTSFVPDYPVTRAEISNLIDKYAQIHPDTRLEFIDPSSHPDMARQLGIRQLGEMLVEYNGRQEKLERIDEPGLSNAIARLSLDNSQWIVNIHGHGEASLYDEANFDLSDFNQKLRQQGYKNIEHQLSATGQIPKNTAMLLLAAPRTSLSDPEVQILLDYLEQGGNLLWLADGEIPEHLAPTRCRDRCSCPMPGPWSNCRIPVTGKRSRCCRLVLAAGMKPAVSRAAYNATPNKTRWLAPWSWALH